MDIQKQLLVDSIDQTILKYHLRPKFSMLWSPGTHDIEYLKDYKTKVEQYAFNNRVTIIEYPITDKSSLVEVLPKNIDTLEAGIKYINDDGFHLLKQNSKYYLFCADKMHIKKT